MTEKNRWQKALDDSNERQEKMSERYKSRLRQEKRRAKAQGYKKLDPEKD